MFKFVLNRLFLFSLWSKFFFCNIKVVCLILYAGNVGTGSSQSGSLVTVDEETAVEQQTFLSI